MQDDDDDELWNDDEMHNVHSGWSYNSVQARDIHGDVIFNSNEPEYFAALPWSFTIAIYAAAFVIAGAYGHALVVDLGFWDWVKLTITLVIVVRVFMATEYRLHGADFAALRLLITVLVVILGVRYGDVWPITAGLASLLSSWITWSF